MGSITKALERDREDVKAKEAKFLEEVSKIAPENLVFIDEAGAHLGMTRTHARSPIGERVVCKRSAARQSNISMVGALTPQGICELYPYDGSVDRERFCLFLDRLIPKLNRENVVVMDNPRVHHTKEVKEKFDKAKIKILYLPPYSPERNPIEESWSKIKNILRSAVANSITDFVDAMVQAKNAITTQNARAFFRHAGYAL